MKNTHRQRKVVAADAIARLADRGENVSRFFTNSGRKMEPIRRVRRLARNARPQSRANLRNSR